MKNEILKNIIQLAKSKHFNPNMYHLRTQLHRSMVVIKVELNLTITDVFPLRLHFESNPHFYVLFVDGIGEVVLSSLGTSPLSLRH